MGRVGSGFGGPGPGLLRVGPKDLRAQPGPKTQRVGPGFLGEPLTNCQDVKKSETSPIRKGFSYILYVIIYNIIYKFLLNNYKINKYNVLLINILLII